MEISTIYCRLNYEKEVWVSRRIIFVVCAVDISENPVRRQYVKKPEDWVWSSANPDSDIVIESVVFMKCKIFGFKLQT